MSRDQSGLARKKAKSHCPFVNIPTSALALAAFVGVGPPLGLTVSHSCLLYLLYFHSSQDLEIHPRDCLSHIHPTTFSPCEQSKPQLAPFSPSCDIADRARSSLVPGFATKLPPSSPLIIIPPVAHQHIYVRHSLLHPLPCLLAQHFRSESRSDSTEHPISSESSFHLPLTIQS